MKKAEVLMGQDLVLIRLPNCRRCWNPEVEEGEIMCNYCKSLPLTSEWTTIRSVEGGEILAMDDGDRVRVSFPEDISEDAVRDALSDCGIEVGDSVVFEAGESEGETVAFFSK